FEPLPGAIRAQAEALRRDGAEVVWVAVHTGGRCRVLDHPDDTSSCEARSELFELAQSLPPGLVDVIVGGHSHTVVPHRVAGIAVIESFSRGQAFGRVDLQIDPRRHRVVASRIFPPYKMLAGEQYEGSRVEPDARVAATFAEDVARVSALRARALGVEVADRMWPSQTEESPLGNWVADLLRGAMPAADVGVYHGGGLRAELRAGALTFGALYEVLPFDNRPALMTMRGATLKHLLLSNYRGNGHGILSLAGLRATLRCTGAGASPELLLTTTN